MTDKKEFAYWIALAHLPKMHNRRKNDLIVRMHEEKATIIDFFHSDKRQRKNIYELTDDEIILIELALAETPNNAFLVEDLLEQGYELIPITSPDYAPTLKANLKRTYAPPLIYIKGNKKILFEDSIAIVGSREASAVSLEFTDTIAKQASKDFKVVVSGFAKGVDKQALDSAIKYRGQSIIVLPQGIMTFTSGYKTYYKQIINGDVLVFSAFFPKAPWSVQLAMGRNPIIYGLAKEIFVAESSDKGGTWAGVSDGLKKGRTVYVRLASVNENNANNLLIQNGAIPVSLQGEILDRTALGILPEKEMEKAPEKVARFDSEKVARLKKINPEIDDVKLFELLANAELSSKEIIGRLGLSITAQKLTNYLKGKDEIRIIKNKKPSRYTLRNTMRYPTKEGSAGTLELF